MEIRNRGRILEIQDARIIYRNFEGRADKYNREGDRNFAIVIPDQDICNQLVEDGWNVRIRDPREGYEDPFMFLPVKVHYSDNGRGPAAYVNSGGNVTRLSEETIGMLDNIDIFSVDLDIRPYDWNINGDTGRKAYLEAIHVTQKIDRFGAMYAAEDML